MAGYYRKSCQNFSILTTPLTNLLRKQEPFIWTSACQEAFNRVKVILMSSPVLTPPDFDKQFKLYVDVSDVDVEQCYNRRMIRTLTIHSVIFQGSLTAPKGDILLLRRKL